MQHYRICCLVYVHLKLYIHIVAFITAYWHCSHTMWKGLCNSMMSIHLSVCLFHPSATAAACGGFTARHLAGRQYWPSHHLATASYGSKDLGTRPRTWPSRPRTWPSRPRTWASRPRTWPSRPRTWKLSLRTPYRGITQPSGPPSLS